MEKSRISGQQGESALRVHVVGLGVQLERAEVGVTEEVRDDHGVSGPVLAAHCWWSRGIEIGVGISAYACD